MIARVSSANLPDDGFMDRNSGKAREGSGKSASGAQSAAYCRPMNKRLRAAPGLDERSAAGLSGSRRRSPCPDVADPETRTAAARSATGQPSKSGEPDGQTTRAGLLSPTRRVCLVRRPPAYCVRPPSARYARTPFSISMTKVLVRGTGLSPYPELDNLNGSVSACKSTKRNLTMEFGAQRAQLDGKR